jgi:hypothetical protein
MKEVWKFEVRGAALRASRLEAKNLPQTLSAAVLK